MASRTRVSVKLNKKAVAEFLKSPEVEKALRKLADEIAADTEARYRADGKDYTFEAWSDPTSTRARMIVGSKDGDAVRFSEAERAHLLDEAHKKRDV